MQRLAVGRPASAPSRVRDELRVFRRLDHHRPRTRRHRPSVARSTVSDTGLADQPGSRDDRQRSGARRTAALPTHRDGVPAWPCARAYGEPAPTRTPSTPAPARRRCVTRAPSWSMRLGSGPPPTSTRRPASGARATAPRPGCRVGARYVDAYADLCLHRRAPRRPRPHPGRDRPRTPYLDAFAVQAVRKPGDDGRRVDPATPARCDTRSHGLSGCIGRRSSVLTM